MVKVKLGINLNKSGNNINLNKPSNNINLNKPENINLSKPTQELRDKDNEPGNLRIPGFREAPGGMEEIGNTGFYRTPSEPADPQDCERYPDSPWCGENPLSLTPFGFEPSIVLTPCDIGIRFDGSFGFIKMPPVGLTYRNLNCRETKPDNVVEVPQPNRDIPPLYLPNNIPTEAIVFVFINVEQTINGKRTGYNTSPDEYYIANTLSKSSFTWVNFVCPGRKGYLIGGDAVTSGSYSYTEIKKEEYSEPKRSSGNFSILFNPQINLFPTHNLITDYSRDWQSEAINNEIHFDGHSFPLGSFAEWNSNHKAFVISDLKFSTGIVLLHGKWGLIRDRLIKYHQDTNKSNVLIELIDIGTITTNISIAKILFANCADRIPLNPPPLLPEPPMTCCSDDLIRLLIQKIDRLPKATEVNEHPDGDLIKSLIQKVDRLSEVVGIDEYPATVPDSFINKRGGFLGEVQPPNNIQIPSLTKFLEWFVKRYDELMGEWEIPIEIKDSDPTTPGDQELGIKLPNLAEAVAEMMLLLLQIAINSETLLNMNTRTMVEVGQDKQQNFKSYMLIDAIADYLGFKYEEKKFKLPMLFNVGKEDYAELLQENETEVVAAEFNDKQNFQEALHRLLEGAAITKSAHFRKLNVNGDMAKQIVDIIKNYSKANKQAQKDDFDAFIEEVETGFTNTPGISDASKPYGRDYSQRPKIREIGNTSDQD